MRGIKLRKALKVAKSSSMSVSNWEMRNIALPEGTGISCTRQKETLMSIFLKNSECFHVLRIGERIEFYWRCRLSLIE